MIADIEEQIEKLDRSDRLKVKETLEASLIDENDPLPERHKKVLDERMKRIESGEANILSLDEFTAALDKKIDALRNESQS